MVRSLLRQNILSNKSVDEVKQLLGEPEQHGDSYLAYQLDYGGLDRITPGDYFLLIQFDQKSQLVKAVGIVDG